MLRSVTGGSTIIIRVSGFRVPLPLPKTYRRGDLPGLRCSRLGRAPPGFEAGLDLVEQSRQVDGLGVEIRAADLDALGAIARQRVRGQRDDGDRRGCGGGLDQLRRFPAVHWAECYVHQYQV